MRTFVITLILLSLKCCQSKQETNNESHIPLIISQYSLSDSLELQRNYRLNADTIYIGVKYVYREIGIPDSLTNYFVIHDSQEGSLIYYRDTINSFTRKDFVIEDKNIKVLKYSFDSSIADSDIDLFYLEDYGIIALRSVDWGNYYTFNQGQKKDSILISELVNDKSGFFRNRIFN